VQVEVDLQAETAVPGGTKPDPGGDDRVRRIEASTLGDGQQRRLEAGGVAEGEQLLRIGTRAALTAQLLRDRKVDVEPAVGRPPVPGSPAFDRRLRGVQDVQSVLLFTQVGPPSRKCCYGTTTRGKRSTSASVSDTDPPTSW
jgi:hypothetical protein